MLPFEQLQKDLEAIQAKLINQVDEMLAAGRSKKEVAKFINEIDFDELLDELGATKAVTKYVYGLDEIVNSFGKDINVSLLDDLQILQTKQTEYILGNLSNKIVLWQETMIGGLISGVKDKEILNSLQSIGLTDSQSGAVLQTSYYNFSRTTTATVFEDDPSQRFKYSGGIIPASSQQCKWLFKNQRKEGYTKQEIDNGIETPFGIINWRGRVPNWNCIHEWRPII